ncbi:MAG: hypothetical protein O7D34_00390 [Ignavibacteria bacterium]|nr:hypothetical protein [Ignavibacteria bacterium]
MGISTELQYATLDDLYLDAMNPRLGRHNVGEELSQEDVLDLMSDWTLDELAVSYLESGFWTHEALLAVEEELYGKPRLVVVEGNRRLAALIYLRRAINGEQVSRKWRLLIENRDVREKLFNEIPYIQVDSREEIESFLGFRHVTGIKEWNPEEKAQYIAQLIDERGMTYEQVMRKIGSKTPTVRENYISYRLLLQMESALEDFSPEYAERRFSVMYLTLKRSGVQKYLQIDIMADPETAKKPVPEDHLNNLANFALWLFGNKKHPPLFADSRQVDNFNRILESPDAVRYLEESKRPNFDYAFQLARGDEPELVRLINEAADSIALSLSRVHHYKDSHDVQRAVKRLAIDFKELLDRFPNVREELARDD